MANHLMLAITKIETATWLRRNRRHPFVCYDPGRLARKDCLRMAAPREVWFWIVALALLICLAIWAGTVR